MSKKETTIDYPKMTRREKLASLVEWKNNPRDIKEADKERLKSDLLTTGQFQPLLIAPGDVKGTFIVIGGNMRLRAIRELVAEGHKEFAMVWVTEVPATNERERVDYALKHNSHAGYYVTYKLVSMVKDAGMVEDDLSQYSIAIGDPVGLGAILKEGEIAETVASKRTHDPSRDEKELHIEGAVKHSYTCPNCSFRW